MNDVLPLEEEQALQDLDGYSSDHVHAQPAELKLLAQLVEIDVKQLEDQTGMPSEEKCMLQLYDVGLELRIKHHHVFQDLDLYFGLLIELGLVSDDLQGHHFSLLVVEGLEHLTEGSLSEAIQDLVPIGDRITCGYLSLAGAACEILDGMDTSGPNIVNFIPQDFLPFQLGQKRVLLFLLIFLDRYRPAPLLHRIHLFLLVRTVELNQPNCTFSVWIRSDLNLVFLSTDYD